MSQPVRLPSCDAAFAPSARPGPGVVVLHEWWGLNDELRGHVDRLAEEGISAIAPNLYDVAATTDPAVARGLAQGMKTGVAMERVAEAVAYLRAQPGHNGKIGVMGFCLGGVMSFAAACSVEGIDAVAPFYGGAPVAPFNDWSRVKAPIQGHFGAKDPVIPVERVQALRDALAAAGVTAELHLYEGAGHAFMRQGDPAAFHAPSAALAAQRLRQFFAQHLTNPR
ncbi:dienelactone hydrolase family protein [Myxococcota bacterium]|nr:dienelactone hydrolase family protein [Myxococcota bacterium]